MHATVGRRHDELQPREQLGLALPRGPHQRLRRRRACFHRRILRRAHIDPQLARARDLYDAVAAREQDLRVARVGDHGAPFPSGHRLPVERRDRALISSAPRGNRAGILLRGVDPVRIRIVRRHVVHLLRGLIIPRAPRRAAVERHDRALVVPHEDAISIGGVDPHLLRIVAAGRPLESGERVAAVRRFVRGGVERVDDVGVFRIDVHPAVVAALSVGNAPVAGIHATPRRPGVVGAIQPPVADQEDALRVGVHRDSDRRAARQSRQSGCSRDVGPGDATVGGLEHLRPCAASIRLRAASRRRADRHVVSYRRREDHVRHVARARQLLDAGFVVHEQRSRPGASAVGAAIHAARVVLGVDVALRRDQDDVGVARVHYYRRDLPGALEPQMLPATPRVRGLVDTVSLVDRAPRDHVPGAGVDHVWIRWRDFDGADRRDGLHGIEHRIPRFARARGLPHAARRQLHVEDARLPDYA